MKIRLSTIAISAVSALSMIPTAAMAQSRDTWNAATVASAAVAVYGATKHDAGLTILGAAGAIYSASRANADHCRPRYEDCRRPVILGATRDYTYAPWLDPANHRDWDRERWERECRDRDAWNRVHREEDGWYHDRDGWNRIRRESGRSNGWDRSNDRNRGNDWNRDNDRGNGRNRGNEWNRSSDRNRGNDWSGNGRRDDPFARH